MQSGKRKRLGERLVSEFTDLRDTLRSGTPVEQRFTVRSVALDLKPQHYRPEAIRHLRRSLGVSQAIFAEILGASVDTVAAWEQGIRKPSPMACRLFEMIEGDKGRWIKRLEEACSA